MHPPPAVFAVHDNAGFLRLALVFLRKEYFTPPAVQGDSELAVGLLEDMHKTQRRPAFATFWGEFGCNPCSACTLCKAYLLSQTPMLLVQSAATLLDTFKACPALLPVGRKEKGSRTFLANLSRLWWVWRLEVAPNMHTCTPTPSTAAPFVVAF